MEVRRAGQAGAELVSTGESLFSARSTLPFPTSRSYHPNILVISRSLDLSNGESLYEVINTLPGICDAALSHCYVNEGSQEGQENRLAWNGPLGRGCLAVHILASLKRYVRRKPRTGLGGISIPRIFIWGRREEETLRLCMLSARQSEIGTPEKEGCMSAGWPDQTTYRHPLSSIFSFPWDPV